jgi:hypothetical protein
MIGNGTALKSAIVIDEGWVFLCLRCFLARRLNGI